MTTMTTAATTAMMGLISRFNALNLPKSGVGYQVMGPDTRHQCLYVQRTVSSPGLLDRVARAPGAGVADAQTVIEAFVDPGWIGGHHGAGRAAELGMAIAKDAVDAVEVARDAVEPSLARIGLQPVAAILAVRILDLVADKGAPQEVRVRI